MWLADMQEGHTRFPDIFVGDSDAPWLWGLVLCVYVDLGHLFSL